MIRYTMIVLGVLFMCNIAPAQTVLWDAKAKAWVTNYVNSVITSTNNAARITALEGNTNRLNLAVTNATLTLTSQAAPSATNAVLYTWTGTILGTNVTVVTNIVLQYAANKALTNAVINLNR